MSGAQPVDSRTAELFATCARAVTRGSDLDTTLRQLAAAGAAAMDASASAVFILDRDSGSLGLLLADGGNGDVQIGASVELGEPADPSARAARERSMVRVRQGEGSGAPLGADWGRAGGLFLPLVVARDGIDLALGVLAFGWRTGGPREEHVALAGPIADLAAAAVDRAFVGSLATERSEWFDRLAHTDPLTGLANRRTFDRMLELELARAGRQGGEVTVAVFDVDAFGATRQAIGTAASDDVLRSVASVLAETVRLVDTIARYGGDEFVLVAPGAAGTAVADRVVRGVSAIQPIEGRGVTISCGVAHFPTDGAASDELLEAAEAALESARSGGGNQVVSAAALAT